MLSQDTVTLHFKPPITKIIQLSQAYNQTFVMLVYLKAKDQDMIYHVDRCGSLIKEYPIDKQFNLFTMTNEEQVVVPNVEKKEIMVINLRTQSLTTVAHIFIEKIDELEFFNFSMSKRLCVKEVSGFNHKQVKLSFYQGPLQNNPLKLADYTKPKDKQFGYITKGNNYSSVVFYNEKNFEAIDLIVIDVVKSKDFNGFDLREKIFSIKIDTPVSATLKNTRPSFVRINFLWEIVEDQYILIEVASKTNTNAQEDNKLKVVNLREKAVRSSNMVIPSKYSLTGQVYFLDQYTAIDVLQTQNNQSQELTVTTLYLNHTEELVDILSQQSEQRQPAKYFPGLQGYNIIKAWYANYQVDTAKIMTIQPISIKNLYMQMLLHINPDFDDDLLFDTMQLLNCL